MQRDSTLFLARFLQLESAGGIALMITAVLALILANTPLVIFYELLLDTPVEVRIAELEIAKPLLLWINDGLMAIFFFFIGLELKRELAEGALADRRNIILPGLGAVGGMALPAFVYVFFNWDDPVALQGWAIPAATDIAFALGILSLLGSRAPTSAKVFLTSLAIFDDIGAILIIAFFYTSQISLAALGFVALCVVVLFFLNRFHVEMKSVYILIGLVMWVSMLKSGVHATLAGVILAMFIPLQSRAEPGYSPLKSMEHDLHGLVAFFVLPVFAFANAGIDVGDIATGQIVNGVTLGIALGLFVGKPVGVLAFCWVGIRAGLARLPEGLSWLGLVGTAVLSGIGFTMSLFIGSLAFEETGVNLLFDERIGIMLGSIASGIVGYLTLRRAFRAQA